MARLVRPARLTIADVSESLFETFAREMDPTRTRVEYDGRLLTLTRLDGADDSDEHAPERDPRSNRQAR